MAKKTEDEYGLAGECQDLGMKLNGGPTNSETDDISPPTPNIVKTSKPSTGLIKR